MQICFSPWCTNSWCLLSIKFDAKHLLHSVQILPFYFCRHVNIFFSSSKKSLPFPQYSQSCFAIMNQTLNQHEKNLDYTFFYLPNRNPIKMHINTINILMVLFASYFMWNYVILLPIILACGGRLNEPNIPILTRRGMFWHYFALHYFGKIDNFCCLRPNFYCLIWKD